MRKSLALVAGALAIAAVAAGPSSVPVLAQTATVSQDSGIIVLTPANFKQVMATTQITVLVTGKDCPKCDAWEAAFKKASPSAMKLGIVDGGLLGVPPQALPLLLENVPYGYRVSRQAGDAPADINAFIADRLGKIAKLQPIIDQIKAKSKEIADLSAPFAARMAPFGQNAQDAEAAHQAALDAVQKQEDADANFQKAKAALAAAQKAFDKAQKPYNDLRQAAEVAYKGSMLQVQQGAEGIIAERNKAVEGPSKELAALGEQLQAEFQKLNPELKQAD